MPSFENIHKNKKWAFIDGILCGVVIAKIAHMWKEATGPLPPDNVEDLIPGENSNS